MLERKIDEEVRNLLVRILAQEQLAEEARSGLRLLQRWSGTRGDGSSLDEALNLLTDLDPT